MNYSSFEDLVGGQNPKEKKKVEKEGKSNQKTSIEIELMKFATLSVLQLWKMYLCKVLFCFIFTS